MARDNWYRLDNIGKFYSAQAGSSAQTVFRCAATLADDIDEEILQRALDKTIDAFPSFNVCLRSGMFWHYLERSDRRVDVTPENLPICFGLHVDTKSILFRVTCYRTRINLEISHMISDGRGTLSFFKTLVAYYIQERYAVDHIQQAYVGSDHQKAENSYDKYFEKDKAASTSVPPVFRLSGRRDISDPTFMEYHLPTHRMLDLSHHYGVSLTALLATALICAIREEMPLSQRDRAIRLDIPVDLRRFFGSSTLKNFFGLAYVSYIPSRTDEPFADIATQVQTQIVAATQPDALKARMNRMIALEKNPFLRLAPMFIKDSALDLANGMAARKVTATVSNLGAIAMADELAPFIRDMDIMTSTQGLSMTICSFRDDLSIGISTVYSNLDVIMNFCRTFSQQGIEGFINSNRTYAHRSFEHAARQMEKRVDDEAL